MMTKEELRKHYEEENKYQKEASELEGILVLLPCQIGITTGIDDECMGVGGFCKAGNVGFWDQTYLSKKRIQDTCRERCPFHKQA